MFYVCDSLYYCTCVFQLSAVEKPLNTKIREIKSPEGSKLKQVMVQSEIELKLRRPKRSTKMFGRLSIGLSKLTVNRTFLPNKHGFKSLIFYFFKMKSDTNCASHGNSGE